MKQRDSQARRESDCHPLLFSNHLEEQFPPAGPVVEIYIDDLLPRSQLQFAVHKRNRQGRTEQRGADVAVAVAIVPTCIVGILSILWDDLIEESAQIS